MSMSRRSFLRGSASVGSGLLLGGLGGARLLSAAGATPALVAAIGPLQPDPAGRLDLPAGYSYRVVTKAGRSMPAPQTGLVPGRPDGTAAFAGLGGNVHLVQNHEQGRTADFPVVAASSLTYDPGATGGTTTIVVDGDNRLVDQTVSLAGTLLNCSGGPTPWGTWLSGEESEQRANAHFAEHHGYVFEVDPLDPASNVDPQPLTALGRFPHECAAVDPERGHVYLTEDAVQPNGLFYRFTPVTLPNSLHSLRDGGLLEAMKVRGADDLSSYQTVGTTLDVRWVEVPDPSALTMGSTRKQFTYVDRTNRRAPVTHVGEGGAITRSHKFEGLSWKDGKAHVVCSFARTTDPKDWSRGAHDGQIWSYDPAASTLTLDVYFRLNTQPSGARRDQPDGPDNIAGNPHGGFVVSEDGGGVQHLLFVTADGRKRVFARNALSVSEFTGVTFSPDGSTLFANIQDEGFTFAITGPFAA
jgi:secreted PhoX family phosphatase